MGYKIRAFCTINKLLDRVSGKTSPIGELSRRSRTFSTHQIELASRQYDSIGVTVFSCAVEGVENDIPEVTSTDMLSTLDDFIINASSGGNYLNIISARNPGLTNISTGPVIVADGAEYPAWVAWTHNAGGAVSDVKVWLADSYFSSEYGGYEIRVVPPIADINDLKQSYSTVSTIASQVSYEDRVNAQQDTAGNDPMTAAKTMNLKWIDPNTSRSMMLTWLLVCFGEQALDPQKQLDAIRTYVLRRTGETPAYWQSRIPDIIIQDSITIIPAWDCEAIRSSGPTPYAYSPMVNPFNFREKALNVRYPAVIDPDVDVDTTVAMYKSIAFLTFPDGTGANTPFRELYPDYANIRVNDSNLSKLKTPTIDAIRMIEEGLRLAETVRVVGNIMPLTQGMELMQDGELAYIAYITNGVKHRIMLRESYLAALPVGA